MKCKHCDEVIVQDEVGKWQAISGAGCPPPQRIIGHEPPPPTCPHGCGPLRWVDTSWYCPKCGDEWPEEVST